MKIHWKLIGSHANTVHSHVKTRANTTQESLDLLEAMQIPRRATWKHVPQEYFHVFSTGSAQYLRVFHVALRCIWNALHWFMRAFTWLCVVFTCLHSISMYFHPVLRCICRSPSIFVYSSMALRTSGMYFHVALRWFRGLCVDLCMFSYSSAQYSHVHTNISIFLRMVLQSICMDLLVCGVYLHSARAGWLAGWQAALGGWLRWLYGHLSVFARGSAVVLYGSQSLCRVFNSICTYFQMVV